MNRFLVTINVVVAALGAVAFDPAPAGATSPSPRSSCAAQLDQGATPHGASGAEPAFLGRFVAGLASGTGTYGAIASGLAEQHGGLVDCLPDVG